MKNKTAGFFLNLIALCCGVAALVCYLISGNDRSGMTETTVSALVYCPLAIGALINVIALFRGKGMVKVAAFIAYFFAFAMWAYTQAGYIVNVFMGIDANTFSFAYIVSLIGMVGAMVFSLVSAHRK